MGAPGANGPHGLTIFGLPNEDDDDLQVDFDAGILTGIWDNGDATDLDGDVLTISPGESKPLSDFVAALEAGQLYVQVHTKGFSSADGFTGELREQLVSSSKPISTPEPSAFVGFITLSLLATTQTLKKSQS